MIANGTWRMASGLLFGLLMLAAQPIHAEWYLAGDLLQTRFAGLSTGDSGTHAYLPSRDGIPFEVLKTDSFAWDVGAGYRVPDRDSWISRLWSIEAGYRNFGSVGAVGGLIVLRGPHMAMVTGGDPQGVRLTEYEQTAHLQGGYLRAAKGFDVGLGLELYLSAGFFVASRNVTFWTRSPKGHVHADGVSDVTAGPTVGGGVKYALYKGVKARAGVESHWSVTENGERTSNSPQWLTVGGGVEVPLTGWW